MASSSVTKTDLEKICTKFSINNFISDLPRMLNEVFTLLYNCITELYNPDDKSVTCTKINATYIDATTIVAQNLKFKGSDGTIYNYNDIGKILSEITTKLDSIKNITRKQIDDLMSYPLQSWPLYADYKSRPAGNVSNGKIALIDGGISTRINGVWVDSTVDDGVIYVVYQDMHVYQYDGSSSTWVDLGNYQDNVQE